MLRFHLLERSQGKTSGGLRTPCARRYAEGPALDLVLRRFGALRPSPKRASQGQEERARLALQPRRNRNAIAPVCGKRLARRIAGRPFPPTAGTFRQPALPPPGP